MGAFHAYDIRGIYNKDFDKETVYKVGYFLPQLLGVNNIAVGRDARTSSPEIHEYLLKGITDAGADVTDIGLATTPMVYFATAKYGFGCSVQITASHNPREYNGLKVSRKEALPVGLDSGLGEIERWIAQGKETPKSATPGKVICKDMDWTVSEKKMALTNNAFFMHCLPVRRNMIVTDAVIESPQSIVIPEAANRVVSAQTVIKDILKTL